MHANCNSFLLQAKKDLYEGSVDEINRYSKEYFDFKFPGLTESSEGYKEALMKTQSYVSDRIANMYEAKNYIEDICHQSTAPLERLNDFGMQVVNVPEYGLAALAVMGLATSAILYYKFFGNRFGLFFR